MNTELARFAFDRQNFKELTHTDTTLTINFENYTFQILALHDQDCCEHVYADFEAADIYRKQLTEWNSYNEIIIWGVSDMGFIIEFIGNNFPNKMLIPCYNEQNGYYSDNLQLSINTFLPNSKNGSDIVTVDLDGYKENH